MPTYEYICDDGHETDYRQSMSDEPLKVCPREGCEAEAERKISSGAGVHSNGGSTGAENCAPSDSAPT